MENVEKIKLFIDRLDRTEYGGFIEFFNDISVLEELRNISRYYYLSNAIKYLESEDLVVSDQLNKIEEILTSLDDSRLLNRFNQKSRF